MATRFTGIIQPLGSRRGRRDGRPGDDEAPARHCAPGLISPAEMGRFELPRGFHPNLLSREAH